MIFHARTRTLILGGLLLACGDKAKEPDGVPLPDFDASVVDDQDAGAPLDCTTSRDDQDADRDGFTPAGGDCDDCERGVNPHALDVPNNDADEDCSGADATAWDPTCDSDGTASSADENEAAEALGLCRWVTTKSRAFGVIDAWLGTFVEGEALADPLQVWFPSRFGTITPREGARLVVLSTGRARDVSVDSFTPGCDTFDSARDGQSWSYAYTPPEGYPKDSRECSAGTVSAGAPAFNPVVFSLKLRAPSNAQGFAFDSMFFTYEYPYYVCKEFNDFFAVFVDPKPRGLDDENVLFDADENPIGVNTGLLQVCRKERVSTRDIDCTLGPDLLKDTGFDEGESTCVSDVNPEYDDLGGASTGWLHTEVPISGSKLFTVRFTLWDSGDPMLDSTVVLDNFRWLVDATETGTGPITAGD